MILVEASAGVVHAFDSGLGLTAFAGGGQGSATELFSSYSVVTTVATTGDSVKLTGSNQVGSLMYVKNDGANACDVFPAVGDDLGLGVGVALSLPAGQSAAFILTISNTTWTQLIFEAGASGGDVFKVGTPVDNQVGVWTGDGTIEGNDNFLWDGAVLSTFDAGTTDGLSQGHDGLKYEFSFSASNSVDFFGTTSSYQFDRTVSIGGIVGFGSQGLFIDDTSGSSVGIQLRTSGINQSGAGIGAFNFSGMTEVGLLGVPFKLTDGAADTFTTSLDGADINSVAVGIADWNITGLTGRIMQDAETLAFVSEITGVSFPILAPDGTAGAPSYSFASDTDIGMFRVSADILGLAARATLIAQAVGALGANQFVVAPGAVQNNVSAPDLGFGDGDSGVMQTVDDTIALVAGANLAVRYAEASGSVIQTNNSDVALTASVTQTQAGGLALLSSYNEISTVGTTGDALTAFDVFQGTRLVVVNNGANDLQLFPAVGDDFGAGVDASITIAAGDVGVFLGRDSVNWDALLNAAAGGGGDVFKVGTPVDNQVGVWTGDGTIEGTTGLTYDGSALEVAGTIQVSNAAGPAMLDEAATSTNPTLVPNRADPDTGISGNGVDQLFLVAGAVQMLRATEVPGSRQITITPGIIDNNPALPALAFGDADTGFYESADDTLKVSIDGTARFVWAANSFNSEVATGPAMLNVASGALIPVFTPDRSDSDTGLASAGADILTLPVGGVEALRLAEVSSRIIQTNANHVGLTASVTQTQGGGLALLSSYNEVATVANEGDALTAFAVTEGIRLVVINNGANGLQLFPASGDDIGAGVNAAITISANSAAVFLGRDATNWDQLQNQGQNGGAVFQGLGTWRYRTEITSPPASGQVRFNNADPTLATEMFLAETNANGTDVNNFLDLLTAGSIFYIQDKAISANFFLVEISSNVDNGTDRTFGIANIILEGAEPSQNTEVLIVATESGADQLVFPEFQFFADQLENPNNADWTVNALAPASPDSNNAGLTVRLFDDTTEEGVGFTIEVPADATNIVFDFVGRAETGPGVANTVGLDIYNRGIPDNAAVQAWSSATQLTDLDIPTNEFFQEDTQTVALATLGVTAGETTQFELVRVAPTGGTDLTGDWAMLLVKVSFT
jgi:hypothetical protein